MKSRLSLRTTTGWKGLGAYVNVFLLTKVQWSQAAIGAVLSTSGLIGIMAHPAVGAFIDRTRAKRALIIAGAFVLSGCGLAIVWMRVLPIVLIADIIMAVLGGVFAPTVAAITLVCGQEAGPSWPQCRIRPRRQCLHRSLHRGVLTKDAVLSRALICGADESRPMPQMTRRWSKAGRPLYVASLAANCHPALRTSH
jgi:hypothetical protein